MIAFVHMAYEFEGTAFEFIDFGDLSDEVVNAIIEIRNRYQARGDSPWEIEGRFPEGEAKYLSPWESFLNPEHFFTYTRHGRRVPAQEGDSRKTTREGSAFKNLEPTDAFDRLPLEVLEKLAVGFREHLEDESYYFVGDDEIVVFTPLFEQEVERRR